VKKTTTTSSALRLAKLCREVVLDKKAEDVLLLDVRKVSSVADYMLICSGNSEPQLKAISEAITMRLRDDGVRSTRRTATASSRWVVLDYGDVLVHVFHPELRQKYALEQLWGDAKRVK
jgi:ribosome-associated protein